MANRNVLCDDGANRQITCVSVKCPSCGTLSLPVYLCYDHYSNILFCKCPVNDCGSHFMMKNSPYGWGIIPNHSLNNESFSEIINSISPNFSKIYNESYAAEQMSLFEVCGVGYRKALEFLIKDYVMEGKDDVTKEKIKKMLLAQCIETYVNDINVKNVSKRAVWLGNDETHYVRKWEGKDIKDLKGLIRLTIRWIEQEKETAALLVEMPDGR